MITASNILLIKFTHFDLTFNFLFEFDFFYISLKTWWFQFKFEVLIDFWESRLISSKICSKILFFHHTRIKHCHLYQFILFHVGFEFFDTNFLISINICLLDKFVRSYLNLPFSWWSRFWKFDKNMHIIWHKHRDFVMCKCVTFVMIIITEHHFTFFLEGWVR